MQQCRAIPPSSSLFGQFFEQHDAGSPVVADLVPRQWGKLHGRVAQTGGLRRTRRTSRLACMRPSLCQCVYNVPGSYVGKTIHITAFLSYYLSSSTVAHDTEQLSLKTAARILHYLDQNEVRRHPQRVRQRRSCCKPLFSTRTLSISCSLRPQLLYRHLRSQRFARPPTAANRSRRKVLPRWGPTFFILSRCAGRRCMPIGQHHYIGRRRGNSLHGRHCARWPAGVRRTRWCLELHRCTLGIRPRRQHSRSVQRRGTLRHKLVRIPQLRDWLRCLPRYWCGYQLPGLRPG
jgi:hypothetical protein